MIRAKNGKNVKQHRWQTRLFSNQDLSLQRISIRSHLKVNTSCSCGPKAFVNTVCRLQPRLANSSLLMREISSQINLIIIFHCGLAELNDRFPYSLFMLFSDFHLCVPKLESLVRVAVPTLAGGTGTSTFILRGRRCFIFEYVSVALYVFFGTTQSSILCHIVTSRLVGQGRMTPACALGAKHDRYDSKGDGLMRLMRLMRLAGHT